MIFNVCEHYLDESNILDDINICVICLEPVEVVAISAYVKLCECNSVTHTTCLDAWYNTTHTCPICRSPMNKINEIVLTTPTLTFAKIIYVCYNIYMIYCGYSILYDAYIYLRDDDSNNHN